MLNNLAPNTEQWYEWRKKGIGASDAPVVMGFEKFKTRYQLWREKADPEYVEPEGKNDFIFQKGHREEEKTRLKYEVETGLRWSPMLAEHSQYPWIKASLDGYNSKVNALWEHKVIGQDEFEKLKETNEIPEIYFPQVHHQVLVTGAQEIRFCCTCEGSYHTVIRKPDYAYIKEQLFPELLKFWDLVISKTPPELSDKDAKKVTSRDLMKLMCSYRDKVLQFKKMESEISDLKNQIFNHEKFSHSNMFHANVSAKIGIRKGAISWKKYAEECTRILKQYDISIPRQDDFKSSGSVVKKIEVKD